MSSALRRQVDALRQSTSGTSNAYLQRKKGKPSLLLTPDQAADVDLSSVREAAVTGLQRLEAVDPDFSLYHESLFSKDAEGILRELQTKELNERIDKSITSFLALLSPHFCSREAHLCLEYLIRHYKIYQYNVDAVVECCLPWHDTIVFARMVQLLSLQGTKWHFLTPVQTTGSPLPREAIARRCARDYGLLRFLCVAARQSAAAAGADAEGQGVGRGYPSDATRAGRAKLFSFYAAVVIEALDSLGSTSEALLRALLPNVVHGLSATNTPEYQMASYMIMSALAGKGPLSSDVTSAALSALVCKPCKGGLEPSLLCAFALVQSQLGFAAKGKVSSKASAATNLFSLAAFKKLSSTVSLAETLAHLANKFDAGPFLWALLESYVEHLGDEDAEHGASLVRLCTYPSWPAASLPRLIRRLVDRMLKHYLAVAREAERAHDVEGGEDSMESRRASKMKVEVQRILRVLGQRYVEDVDVAVSKVRRLITKRAAEDSDSDEAVDDDSLRATALSKELLLSLLSSTFAASELAPLLPIHVETTEENASHRERSRGVANASLLTAMEHPSADVRARAIEQLARALVPDAGNTPPEDTDMTGVSPALDQLLEDVGPVLVRRLDDENPSVVVALTENRVLWQHLRERSSRALAVDDREGRHDSILRRAGDTSVTSTIWMASQRWLGMICTRRPQHSVMESGKALIGLLKLAAQLTVWSEAGSPGSTSMSSDADDAPSDNNSKGSVSMFTRLLFECLPGPHAMSRMRSKGGGSSTNSAAEPAQEVTKARKRAMRFIGREAIRVVHDAQRSPSPFLEGFAAALRKMAGSTSDEGVIPAGNGSERQEAVTGQGRSKPLKTMSAEVCASLCEAFASGDVKSAETVVPKLTPGGQWLSMEAISRAIARCVAHDEGVVKEHVTKLASLLARISISRLREGCVEDQSALAPTGSPSQSDILAYLEVCAPHLPASESHGASLFAADHGLLRRSESGANDMASPISFGEVLLAVLEGASDADLGEGNVGKGDGPGATAAAAAWEVVGTILMHCSGTSRPMCALASLVIAACGSQDQDATVIASRALYLAATLVRAEAEAKETSDEDRDPLIMVSPADIVAAVPAAILAMSSRSQILRNTGYLLVSTVATHGEVIVASTLSRGKSSSSRGKKGTRGSRTGGLEQVEDSEIFPLLSVMSDGSSDPVPSALRAPEAGHIIAFSKIFVETCDGAGDDIREQLETLLGEGGPGEAHTEDGFAGNVKDEVRRYVVAWGARLAWRDPEAAVPLLESLSWAKLSIRECCSPLLDYHLRKERLPAEMGAGLMRFLCQSILTWTDGSGHATGPRGNLTAEAEALLCRALEASERTRRLTLEAMAASPCALIGDNIDQKQHLIRIMVQVSIDGVDADVVMAAAGALPVRPADMAHLIRGLLREAKTLAEGNSDDKKSGGKLRGMVTRRSWARRLAAATELVQALSSRFDPVQGSGKGRRRYRRQGKLVVHAGDSPSSSLWRGNIMKELAGPLFGAITELLPRRVDAPQPPVSVAGVASDAATTEYALWMTMDVLAGLIRRQRECVGERTATGTLVYPGNVTEDADRVLNCLKESPSPQARNSALSLLSALTSSYPAQMASRLRVLLDTVGRVAAGSHESDEAKGGIMESTLRLTQKAVQSMVVALKAHGAEVGINSHTMVQVFVDALDGAPVHARRALFGTLVDALGDESLVITSCLILRQVLGGSREAPVSHATVQTRSDVVEFVHQTCYFSRAQVQVQILVKLVQVCHRLVVMSAKRSGVLLGQAYEDAVCAFSSSETEGQAIEGEENGSLVVLVLDGGSTAGNPRLLSAPFLCLDLESMLKDLAVEVADRTWGKGRSKFGGLAVFLETLLGFVRDHLVSKSFLSTAAASGGRDGAEQSDEVDGLQETFVMMCEEVLLLLKTLGVCEHQAQALEDGSGNGGLMVWRTLRTAGYTVLDTQQSLLSIPSFVAVTQELLEHHDPVLRRRALQMCSERLSPSSGAPPPRLSRGEEALFVDMLPSLRRVVVGVRRGGRSRDLMDTGSHAEEDVEREIEVNRQTTLLVLDVLARVLGRRYQSAFAQVLEDVTHVVAGTGPGALPAMNVPGSDRYLPLRSSAFLLVATLCAVLGHRAFPQLPRFFPAMLDALEYEKSDSTLARTHGNEGSRANDGKVDDAEPCGGGAEASGKRTLLWTSALSAVGGVAASLPTFLSPHLSRIMAIALRPASVAGLGELFRARWEAEKKAADRVLSLMAAGVEARLLVPAICGAYDACLRDGTEAGSDVTAARGIERLLLYVQEVIAGMERGSVSAALPSLRQLLTKALDFRRLYGSSTDTELASSAIELVDVQASAALVSIVMKLSEVELRPLWMHLVEWKGSVSGGSTDLQGLDRRLSFYRVLDDLAGSLKSIFTPYFAHVVEDCREDLDAAHEAMTKTEDNADNARERPPKRRRTKDGVGTTMGDSDVPERAGEPSNEVIRRRSAIARLVLSALHRCFKNDRSGFLDKARFESLMPAVVSQLECGGDASDGSTGEAAGYREHAERFVAPCLAQLANAVGEAALWKALTNATLMRTRSTHAGVRVAALVAVRQCFEVVGEEYLVLLPECLPFLSELLEDVHPEVEGECRTLVKYIEGLLGESIESYLN